MTEKFEPLKGREEHSLLRMKKEDGFSLLRMKKEQEIKKWFSDVIASEERES